MNYIYVSYRTKDYLDVKDFINYHDKHDYLLIKRNKNYWGIFLQDIKKEIIGHCLVKYEKEYDVTFLLLVMVYIREEYRGYQLCKNLIKETIIRHENKKKTKLIKVVIAGGINILKCLINVFKELNYNIKNYKTGEENIQKLKIITFQDAIEIEKKNFESDIWQTLFFEKNDLCKIKGKKK